MTDLSLGAILISFLEYQNCQKIAAKIYPQIVPKNVPKNDARKQLFSKSAHLSVSSDLFITPFRTFLSVFVYLMERSAALRKLRQRFPSSADLSGRLGVSEYPSVCSDGHMTICRMPICPCGPDRMITCPYAHMVRTV